MSGTNDPRQPAPSSAAQAAEPAAAPPPAPAPAPEKTVPDAPAPAPKAEAIPATASVTTTPSVADPEPHADAAATADTPDRLTAGTEEAATDARPSGRPSRGLLAGAAVAGALLVGVPFLVSGMLHRSGSDGSASDRSVGAGTVLDDPAADGAAGAYGSASPTVSPSPSDSEDAKGGKGEKHGGKGDGKKGAVAGAGAAAESSGKAAAKGSSGGGEKKSGGGAVATRTVISAPGITLYSHASNRCIEVVGHRGADGSPLQIWDCGKKDWQKWDFRSDGTIHSMGLCMDVAWGSRDNGAVIQLAVCSGNPAQQFRLSGAGDLVNPQANKCVDVKDQATGNGTRLQLWDCNGQDNQKWSTR
jgi:hypothetical protein